MKNEDINLRDKSILNQYKDYIAKFEEFGAELNYKYDNWIIKTNDIESSEIKIYKHKKIKNDFDRIINYLELARLIQSEFIDYNFDLNSYNENLVLSTNLFQNGERYEFIIQIRQKNDKISGFIVKEAIDCIGEHNEKINNKIYLNIESAGFEGLKVYWQYNFTTTNKKLLNEIKTALEALDLYIIN